MVDFKPEPLGDRLTSYELQLYEYSAFSLSEEVDLHHCRVMQKLQPFEEAKLKPKVQYLLELLEQAPASTADGLSEEIVVQLTQRRFNCL